MKFQDIKTIMDAKYDYEKAKTDLEKTLCITDAVLYYNGYPSGSAGSELISDIKKVCANYHFVVCELALTKLKNLGIDVSEEIEALKLMVIYNG